MITHPPATVTKQRYELYKQFVEDQDIPVEMRDMAVYYFNKYRALKDVGESMAGELVWRLIIYVTADPINRMSMFQRGKAFQAQKEWEELDRKNKRERQV